MGVNITHLGGNYRTLVPIQETGADVHQKLTFFGARSAPITSTSRLRQLVLCILHSMFFVKEKNKNAAKNCEGSPADICDVISRDYVFALPQL